MERKSSRNLPVNKAIKIKYILFFSFYFHYKAQHASSAKDWKVNILPTGETSGRKLWGVFQDTMKESSYKLQVKKVTFYGWLYQLMGRAG